MDLNAGTHIFAIHYKNFLSRMTTGKCRLSNNFFNIKSDKKN